MNVVKRWTRIDGNGIVHRKDGKHGRVINNVGGYLGNWAYYGFLELF
jgi:hypothetical protein